jgi:hypothetical protein
MLPQVSEVKHQEGYPYSKEVYLLNKEVYLLNKEETGSILCNSRWLTIVFVNRL